MCQNYHYGSFLKIVLQERQLVPGWVYNLRDGNVISVVIILECAILNMYPV